MSIKEILPECRSLSQKEWTAIRVVGELPMFLTACRATVARAKPAQSPAPPVDSYNEVPLAVEIEALLGKNRLYELASARGFDQPKEFDKRFQLVCNTTDLSRWALRFDPGATGDRAREAGRALMASAVAAVAPSLGSSQEVVNRLSDGFQREPATALPAGSDIAWVQRALGLCGMEPKVQAAIEFPIPLVRDLALDLLGYSEVAAEASVTVPFSVVDVGENASGKGLAVGRILEFRLELLPVDRQSRQEYGTLYPAIDHTFTWMDSQFRNVFTVVPLAVQNSAELSLANLLDLKWREEVRGRYNTRMTQNVRVRIFDMDGQPFTTPLIGDSATAAAARGLWFLQSGLVPDDGILVLGRVASDGHVAPVRWVREKVLAAVACGRPFDTIFATKDGDPRHDNVKEAENALEMDSEIRVVFLSGDRDAPPIEQTSPVDGKVA